ncbi:T-cell-specific surface glycoprotein CD28 precursor [Corchorus olitorius]|uniref:T-cell-specific surface glycoprotein CD28 n=1 Tax=Corchorus olitorius TaxID=93759 RepID=A0A1R3G9Y8_9ROSI|nr:T-cell-specific surface glycoprotein CD28 precursor [Corchorus olitorius]
MHRLQLLHKLPVARVSLMRAFRASTPTQQAATPSPISQAAIPPPPKNPPNNPTIVHVYIHLTPDMIAQIAQKTEPSPFWCWVDCAAGAVIGTVVRFVANAASKTTGIIWAKSEVEKGLDSLISKERLIKILEKLGYKVDKEEKGEKKEE